MKSGRILCFALALRALAFRRGVPEKTPARLLEDAVKAMRRGDLIGATIKAQDADRKVPQCARIAGGADASGRGPGAEWGHGGLRAAG